MDDARDLCAEARAVADAHALAFADASVSNLVRIDVIHHRAEPGRFLMVQDRHRERPTVIQVLRNLPAALESDPSAGR